VVDKNPKTRVSDAIAVTFSVKRFNPLKLYPLSGKKVVCFVLLFTPEHLIII